MARISCLWTTSSATELRYREKKRTAPSTSVMPSAETAKRNEILGKNRFFFSFSCSSPLEVDVDGVAGEPVPKDADEAPPSPLKLPLKEWELD